MDSGANDLGPTGLLEVGRLTDAQLGVLAPRAIARSSWWSAPPAGGQGEDDGDDVPAHRLAWVRAVLHAADSVTTWESDEARGAFVVADDVVLADRIVDGRHDLVLAEVATAVAMLAVGLDPRDLARHRDPQAGRLRAVPARRLVDALPPADARRSIVRLVRVTHGPRPTETVVTVVGAPDGVTAWRALPEGGVVSTRLDRDGVVATAIALLVPGEVAT